MKIAVFSIWLLLSLYTGIGGYVLLDVEKRKEQAKALPEKQVKFGLITYRNIEMALAAEDERMAYRFFPLHVDTMPKSMLYLITAMAFGAIGGVTEMVKKMAISKTPIQEITVYTTPLLGGLIGILVLGIANLLPDLLMVGERAVDPMSLAFFSLLAGLSSKSFFRWLLKVNDNLFTK